MLEVPRATKSLVRKYAYRDLKPNYFAFATKLAFAFALGSFVSLLFLGQFSIALTEFARRNAERFHADGGLIGGFQGAIFSLGLACAARVVLRPLQVRYLRRKGFLIIAMTAACEIALTRFDWSNLSVTYLLIWFLGAWLSFVLLMILSDKIIRRPTRV